MPRSRSLPLTLALGVMVALLCAAPATIQAAPPPQMQGVDIDIAWGAEHTFNGPILALHAGDGSGNLYVVERLGRVYRMADPLKGEAGKKEVFLDLRSTVTGVDGAQGGLLSIAFHPSYRTNKRYFVSYLAKNTDDPSRKFAIVIEERVSDGTKDVGSKAKLLWIRKKTALHNAGHIAFDRAGMLLISTGDDIQDYKLGARHASQNMVSPLGKILRIDVNGPKAQGKAYGIPRDNPWADNRFKGRVYPEIWALGLRNPWRFSVDPQGRVWTAEPGTSNKVKGPPGTKNQEWVTQIVRGGNHGWPFFEGKRQLLPTPPIRPASSMVPRTFAYPREGEGSTAGIGGFVYRGSRIPALRGKYIFADFGRGHVYAIDLVPGSTNLPGTATRAVVGANWKLLAELPNIASLGEDESGEIYICSAEEEGMIAFLIPGS